MLRVPGCCHPWRESMSRREVMYIGGLNARGFSLPQMLRAQGTSETNSFDSRYQFSAHGQLARRAGPYAAFLGNADNPVWTEFDGTATKEIGRTSFLAGLKKEMIRDSYLGITPGSKVRLSKSAQMTKDDDRPARSLVEQLDDESRRCRASNHFLAVQRINEKRICMSE